MADVALTSGAYYNSDSTLKVNIEPLVNCREKVLELRPVSFDFVPHQKFSFPSGTNFGFLAQEVQIIFPELVKNVTFSVSDLSDSERVYETFKGMNSIELIPILTGAIQDQAGLIDENTNKVSSLQALLSTTQLLIDQSNIK
jgi:hypothetical protein